MHQHVGVILPRGGFFQDGHQLFPVRHEEGVQVFPLVQRGNERADFTVARLMVRQQLQFVAAVEVQQRGASGLFTQRVQLVQGKTRSIKFSRSTGSCSRPSSSTGSHG
jgi:hypothetical protein